MDRKAAKNLVETTFNAPFAEDQFRYFIRNLLNSVDENNVREAQGARIIKAFREDVQQYKRVGVYTDPDGEKIDILVVKLAKKNALDYARTKQRNFVAKHLSDADDRSAALVATYHPERTDWRFSLVRLEYSLHFDEKTERLKTEKVLTPARRFSFLVGENEPNHTAQQQLVPVVADTARNPDLAMLESAFNIESVTKEFFEDYKGLFLNLKDTLDHLHKTVPAVQAEFERTAIDTATFAKKLLGQIVFLYFLQKKGWLGVAEGKPWGDGPKNFLRRLFDQQPLPNDATIQYQNFFNDVLEPLFYEALALERPGDLYGRLNCKIPFLNGGLFEPANGYRWREVDILLDNDLFKKVFRVFDLYNFTVREDEPLEKEVAVDPEMLGKVFENLLDVQDRKSKGAFYTPREIVHYMCQESLINYLGTSLNIHDEALIPPAPKQGTLFGEAEPEQLGLTVTTERDNIPREDLDAFIRHGELSLENDAAKEQGTVSYTYIIPDSIRLNAQALDEALATIKICDPAIGSGAFPVGLMHEIVKARTVLTPYLRPQSTYDLKRHAIQESIYGVDIDPAAVDIAKLRLWLSLVVDEEDYQHIQPLPNLDYKIVCGNALLSYPYKPQRLEELEMWKEAFFGETDPEQKQALREKIDALIDGFFDKTPRSLGYQVTFEARVHFSEVYREKKGFDIIIGNPPYVRMELIKEIKPALKATYPDAYAGRADIYVYFYALGLRLLADRGVLAYISSNKFLRAKYGTQLRHCLSNQSSVRTIIDFGDLPVFDATAYPSIVIISKQRSNTGNELVTTKIDDLQNLFNLQESVKRSAWKITQKDLQDIGWSLVKPEIGLLIDQLRKVGRSLSSYIDGKFYYGIKTGYNDAFVIDETTRQRLISEDPNSNEIIKPWLRGRDINRWKANWSNLYLIFTYRGVGINTYPAVLNYLTGYKTKLENRATVQSHPWYELQQPQVGVHLEGAKSTIIYPHFNIKPSFAFDETGALSNDKSYIIPNGSLFLLAILNSRVSEFFLNQICPSVRGNYREFRTTFVGQIPIPIVDISIEQKIQASTQRLLNRTKNSQDVTYLENEIDQLVYKLYDLDPPEIAIIEAQTGGNA